MYVRVRSACGELSKPVFKDGEIAEGKPGLYVRSMSYW